MKCYYCLNFDFGIVDENFDRSNCVDDAAVDDCYAQFPPDADVDGGFGDSFDVHCCHGKPLLESFESLTRTYIVCSAVWLDDGCDDSGGHAGNYDCCSVVEMTNRQRPYSCCCRRNCNRLVDVT